MAFRPVSRMAAIGICLSLGAAGAVARAQTPELQAGLPEAAREALDHQFDEWQMPDSSGVDRSCRLPASAAAPAPFVTGDFDGDRLVDVALYVEADGATRLAVILARFPRHQLFLLDLPPGESLPILEVQPRSTRYTEPASAIENHLSTDTPVVERCGSGRSLFRWLGFRFDRLDLPVSPAS